MSFNISEIRQRVGDHHLLTGAELRFFIRKPMIRDKERVELYYGQGTSLSYLKSLFISNNWKDKWMSIDVKEPLKTWLRGTGKITNFTLYIFMFL